MTDYSGLKRLAEVQTVKEWSSHDRGMSMFAKERMYGVKGPECVPDHEDWGYTRRAASYIAAANPAAVLGLIADNERLTSDNSSLRGSLKSYSVNMKKQIKASGKVERERDALKAECEGLRKALIDIRENSSDLGACECAADALVDTRKGGQSND